MTKVAGGSASARARHLRERAAESPEDSARLLAEAGRFAVAGRTEDETVRLLAGLVSEGFHFLSDRRWPGTKHSQVDLVLVGRTGVFIVDTKAWSEFALVGDRPFRGQADASDTFDSLRTLLTDAQEVFAEVGLPPGEVHCIAAMTFQPRISTSVGPVEVIGTDRLLDRIRQRGARLSIEDVERLAGVARDYFPVIRDPETPSLLPDAPAEPEPSFDLEAFQRGLLHLDEAPIETWMSYLDPAQARVARRSFNGPARIRGAAGTGKTVVGLHRTAHIARATTGKVLVTTYVKTFPAVLQSLLHRLEPDHAHKVEFRGVHSFAWSILQERRISVVVDQDKSNVAWWRAWHGLPTDHRLRDERFGPAYWRDEVDHVIKGRGLRDFDEYAKVARVGRKYRLTAEQRHNVWQLHQEYDRQLAVLGVVDWSDVVRLARDELRERPLDRYESVVIDEAQDLTCLSVGMLHALVGDRQDGLTLIGDGQQSIYPGGYTLGEIGISLAGRGVVLDVNHRNTRQIAEFARGIVADDVITDIEGTDATGDTIATITRTGPEPVLERFAQTVEHDRALIAALRRSVDRGRARSGDIGVLAPTKETARRLLGVLRKEGIPALSVERYRGETTHMVKVGTIKRAKGLEFKHVLLADIPASLLGDAPSEETESASERRRLDLRELYVGMTRARDELWVGVRS